MTISDIPSKEIKLGNGSATEFSFSFRINKAADLTVLLTVDDAAPVTLTEGTGATNYSLQPTSTFPGTGTVTYPASGGVPMPVGTNLTLLRQVSIDQETDLVNQGAWNPSQVEDALDYLVMISQQQQEVLDRTLRVPATVASGVDYTAPAPSAGRVLAVWNETATALEIGPTAADIASAQPSAAAAVDAAGQANAALAAISALSPCAYVLNRTSLKAVSTSDFTNSYLLEAGREGRFAFKTGDYSAQIAADPQELSYIKADDTEASAGAWVRVVDSGQVSRPTFAGQLQYVSATQLRLQGVRGDEHSVPDGSGGWVAVDISTAPTVDTTGLAASTFHYAYLRNNGSAPIQLSTTGPTWNEGFEVKTGEPDHLLIGYVHTNSSTEFEDSPTHRYVRSYFNREPLKLENAFTAIRSVSGGIGWQEMNAEIRCRFIAAPGDLVLGFTSAYTFNNGAGFTYSGVGLDGNTNVSPAAGVPSFSGGGSAVTAPGVFKFDVAAEHFLTYAGKATVASGSFGATDSGGTSEFGRLSAVIIPAAV